MSQDKVNDENILAKECLDVERNLSVSVNRSTGRRHKKGIFSRQFSTYRGPSVSYLDKSASASRSSNNVDAISKNVKKNSENSTPCEEQVSCHFFTSIFI